MTLTWAFFALPETRPPDTAADHSGNRLCRDSRELLTTPAFAGFVLSAAMISGPFLSFMAAGPHVVTTVIALLAR